LEVVPGKSTDHIVVEDVPVIIEIALKIMPKTAAIYNDNQYNQQKVINPLPVILRKVFQKYKLLILILRFSK
jgi:hypothetical protein